MICAYGSERRRIPSVTRAVFHESVVRWRVVTFVIMLSCFLVVLRATTPIAIRIAVVVILPMATVDDADNSMHRHLGR